MKFDGYIGFYTGDFESSDDVYDDNIEEKPYYGDIIRNNRGFSQGTDQQNAEYTVNNQISLIADTYLQHNYQSIRYVMWNYMKWSVKSVAIDYPRCILEIGGVYNGPIKD